MRKMIIGLSFALFSVTAFAESWFLLGTRVDDGVKIYIDAERLDLDNHKGWIKDVYPKNHKEYIKVLSLVSANCEYDGIKHSNTIMYMKNGEKIFKAEINSNKEYESFGEKSVNAKIFDCLCNEKYFDSKLGDINLKDLNNE